MITIDFSIGFAVLISFILILVFSFWVFYTYSASQMIQPMSHFHRCKYCTFIFFTNQKTGLYNCPRCKSYITLGESIDKDRVENQ